MADLTVFSKFLQTGPISKDFSTPKMANFSQAIAIFFLVNARQISNYYGCLKRLPKGEMYNVFESLLWLRLGL